MLKIVRAATHVKSWRALSISQSFERKKKPKNKKRTESHKQKTTITKVRPEKLLWRLLTWIEGENQNFQEKVVRRETLTEPVTETLDNSSQSWSATDVSTLPTLESILFNKSLDLTEKLAQAEEIIKNVRLFIGFASDAEFQNTVKLLALQDIEGTGFFDRDLH